MSAEGDSARPGPDVSGTSSDADPAVPQERVAVTAVMNQFNSALEPNGMAVMPFQVGWYNELVIMKPHGERYLIDAAADALALVIVSSPHMWARFKDAYAKKSYPSDPVDTWCRETIALAMEQAASALPVLCGGEAGVTFLSEGWDRKRFQPYVLVQTAAHVAGAARLYQEADVPDTTWLDEWKAKRAGAGQTTKVFPVAVHPEYGGWFALRGVLVFPNLRGTGLPRREPPDPLPTSQARSVALIKFSEGWTDRDIGMDVAARYENEAIEYFGYKTPRERKDTMLAAIKAGGDTSASRDGGDTRADVDSTGGGGASAAAAPGTVDDPVAGAGRGAGAGGATDAAAMQ